MYEKLKELSKPIAIKRLEIAHVSNNLTIIGGTAGAGKNLEMRGMIEMLELTGYKSLVLATETKTSTWIKHPSSTNALILEASSQRNFRSNLLEACRTALKNNVHTLFIESVTDTTSPEGVMELLNTCIDYFKLNIVICVSMKRRTSC